MDRFDEGKQRVLARLGRPDRSKKGAVDEEAWPLIDAINTLDDYYTTSSCAGRITLFVEPSSGKKHEGAWLLVSHQPVTRALVSDALRPDALRAHEGTVWFRMEGAIFHIACRDLAAADALLKTCKAAGWKHSGVTGTSPKILIEATTSERIDVPIAKDGERFVPEGFIDYLIAEANRKLEATAKKRARLVALLRKQA